MTSPKTSATIRTELGAIAGQREAVIAEGPDALTFLQGQLSQDLNVLAPGEASFSLVLHPQGKISAWFRITRVTDDRFVIDVDAGWSDEILTRLNRFKLRTAIEITKAPWQSLTIVGPGADDVDVVGFEHDMLTSWAGVPVRDVFGPDLGGSEVEALEVIDQDTFTALRIEGGIPRMGLELNESTIPAAAGIVEQSVSFTKGCYTGQELVARIDSRGNNVPKRLVGIVFEGSNVPSLGSAISTDGSDVGVVTSTGWSGELNAAVGLAYVARSAELGDHITIEIDGVSVPGELRALPLVRL